MKSINFHIIISILVFSALISCSKEQTNLDSSIKFTAEYYQTQTKAPTPFTDGNRATIIGYSSGESPSLATPVNGTPVNAVCNSSGNLITDNEIFLPKGTYDFYSVSLNNNQVAQPVFTSGVSAQLENQVDYLWSKKTSVTAGSTVAFEYFHKAVAIEIITSAGSGITNLTIEEIKITPTKPTTSSKMSLIDGSISASNTKEALTSIPVVNNIGYYIMLPLSTNTLSISIKATLNIGGINYQNKVYTTTIPAREYFGGTLYKINLTLTALNLTFGGSTVEDWTTQTISEITLTEE